MMQWFCSGATRTDEYQADVAQSIGGYRSSVPVSFLAGDRDNPIGNIKINCISPGNGIGEGVIIANDGNTLSWMPPGETTTGTPVTIDETYQDYVIAGVDTDKYIIITRMNDNPFMGQENVYIHRLFGNAIAGVDVDITDSTAAPVDYHSVFFCPPSPATGFTITTDSAGISVALDTPVDGALTATPSALSYSTTVSGDVTGGEGVWIRRETPLAASPCQDVDLHVTYTMDGTSYDYHVSGGYRVSDTSLSGYMIYQGETLLDVVQEADFPYTLSLADGTHTITVRKRNKYGLTTVSPQEKVIAITSGSQLPDRPPRPDVVTAATVQGGKIRVRAIMNTTGTGINPTGWKVLVKISGTMAGAEDYVTVPITSTGSGLLYLDYTWDTVYTDGAPLDVWVHGHIEEDDIWGDGQWIAYTLDRTPSALTGADIFYDGYMAENVKGATAPDTTVFVDSTNDIKFIVKPGRVWLYYQENLVWCTTSTRTSRMLYVPNDYTIQPGQTVATAMTTTQVIEKAGDKLYINVYDTGRMEIDPVAKTIRLHTLSHILPPAETSPPAPAWSRWDSTVFLVWSTLSGAWGTVWGVDDDGNVRVQNAGVSIGMTTADIEGL